MTRTAMPTVERSGPWTREGLLLAAIIQVRRLTSLARAGRHSSGSRRHGSRKIRHPLAARYRAVAVWWSNRPRHTGGTMSSGSRFARVLLSACLVLLAWPVGAQTLDSAPPDQAVAVGYDVGPNYHSTTADFF